MDVQILLRKHKYRWAIAHRMKKLKGMHKLKKVEDKKEYYIIARRPEASRREESIL